jgi:ASC-1-like (ASCH) protein
MDYREKYLKYKQKYFELQQKMIYRAGAQNIYTVLIKQPWFDFIKSGGKNIARLDCGIYKNLQLGDKIIWIYKNLNCQVTITQLTKYKSYKQMIETEGISNTLPSTVTDIESGIKLYKDTYSKEDEIDGIIAVKMELIK